MFQTVSPGGEAARALMSLCQGRWRVSDFATEFRTLAADSGWNTSALIYTFLNGLSPCMKDQLIALELPEDFDSLITLMMRIDK